jgi:hypothetical protein
MEQVEFNIKGVKKRDNFEVIDIINESDPYPALLGIEWPFDNNVKLNLKKRRIPFETDTLCIVTPLDPYEGSHYNELIDEDAWNLGIENIYKVMGCREDYINPTIYG